MSDKLIVKNGNDNIEIPIQADAAKPRIGIKGKGYVSLLPNGSGKGIYAKINNLKYKLLAKEPDALKFSSDGNFTLAVADATKHWDGTLEYSINNGSTWTTWTGSQLSGTASQPIYMRGTNNTKITGNNNRNYRWIFTGKYCEGNIEYLLDYQTVMVGNHPTMANYCYCDMFYGCTSLTTVPELPATTLADGCYANMFNGCTFTTPPELPATTLTASCYSNMFNGCTSLTTPPELPATTSTASCYVNMFQGCTSLTTLPKLPATTLRNYCYRYMFLGCSNIKLSTTQTGEYQYPFIIHINGTMGTKSLENMFANTGGTFTGTPTVNTTYYTNNQPI